MSTAYDKYYKTQNYFGKASQPVIDFFMDYPHKGKVLDLGCGQGRNAIPIARLGFDVTGIDLSKVGVGQMLEIGLKGKLSLTGVVLDFDQFTDYALYDFILLDSMFHFNKKDRLKEVSFIEKIIRQSRDGTFIIFCIQDIRDKVNVLNNTILMTAKTELISNLNFDYQFSDPASGHGSRSPYKMIIIKKADAEE